MITFLQSQSRRVIVPTHNLLEVMCEQPSQVVQRVVPPAKQTTIGNLRGALRQRFSKFHALWQMAQKRDDVLFKRKDKCWQMILQKDPFALEIMTVPLSKGFKQPMIETYDRVTNPLDCLLIFVDLMRLYTNPDAVMRRSFPSKLKREARDQVATLAPRFIKTFDGLSRNCGLLLQEEEEDNYCVNTGCIRERQTFAGIIGQVQQGNTQYK